MSEIGIFSNQAFDPKVEVVEELRRRWGTIVKRELGIGLTQAERIVRHRELANKIAGRQIGALRKVPFTILRDIHNLTRETLKGRPYSLATQIAEKAN